MQYYYDIDLHFDDHYINYYLWETRENFKRLPIFKVESIKVFLDYEVLIDVDYKNIIVSDGVSSIALELVRKQVAYLSSISYDDEFRINEIALSMDEYLDYKIKSKKEVKLINKIDKIKTIYIESIEQGNRYFIKYLYYELTGNISNDLKSMKKYLVNEIKNNFCDKYYQLYDKIIIGD